MLTLRVLELALAVLFTATTAAAQATPFGVSKCDPEPVVLSNIRLPQAVMADGKRLAGGTYQLRVTSEHPTPAVGQSPNAECWVEFVKDGHVVGREVASVISATDIAAVTKDPAPESNQSRTDVLKGSEYVRVWVNRAGDNYLINMPVAR